jgi:DNA-binding transcriptional LysR family regulator
MQLDDLEAYSLFAECLNFTKAAESLSISQPALHVKIRKLGENLGTSLYVKTGRKLTLTQSGKELARYARETLNNHQRFLSSLKGETGRSRVTLAAGSGSFLYLLGPAIRRFLADYQGELRLLRVNRKQALESLRLGQAELAVTVLAEPPTEFLGHLVSSIPTQLVVPEGHRFRRRKKISVSELAEEPLIVPPAGRPFRETLEACFSLAEVGLRVGLEAEGWELMMHFASLGLGATLVNGCCRVPTGCHSIKVEGLPVIHYFLLQLKGRKLSPSGRLLRDEILAR